MAELFLFWLSVDVRQRKQLLILLKLALDVRQGLAIGSYNTPLNLIKVELKNRDSFSLVEGFHGIKIG